MGLGGFHPCSISAPEQFCPSLEAELQQEKSLTPSGDVSGTGPHRPALSTILPKFSAGHSRCRVQLPLPAETKLFLQASQLAALFILTLTLNNDASWENSPDAWGGQGKVPERQTAGPVR